MSKLPPAVKRFLIYCCQKSETTWKELWEAYKEVASEWGFEPTRDALLEIVEITTPNGMSKPSPQISPDPDNEE